jgi:hypothetical protein
MIEHRAHRRFSAKGTAKDLSGRQTGQCGLTVTNFSREGIGVSIPHDYNLKGRNELELQVQVLPNISPVKFSGTLKWLKELRDDEEFAMTGGVKCKEIHPIQLWRLMIINIMQDCRYDNFNKKNVD